MQASDIDWGKIHSVTVNAIGNTAHLGYAATLTKFDCHGWPAEDPFSIAVATPDQVALLVVGLQRQGVLLFGARFAESLLAARRVASPGPRRLTVVRFGRL